VAGSGRTDPQAPSRGEGASLCDLAGPSLSAESRPGLGALPHRARALETTRRAVFRAVRLLSRAASRLRPRSAKLIVSRPASLAAGVT
jgi:hypothetical protein